jgi:hypothetical protein
MISLWDMNGGVHSLLQLDTFQAGRNTLAVSSSLCEHGTTLGTRSAKAMGLVCRQLGLNNVNIAAHHIKCAVSCLVNGWHVRRDSTLNIRNAALTFATALGSRRHAATEVMAAFFHGIEQGTANLEYFAKRRRPTSRRSRSA